MGPRSGRSGGSLWADRGFDFDRRGIDAFADGSHDCVLGRNRLLVGRGMSLDLSFRATGGTAKMAERKEVAESGELTKNDYVAEEEFFDLFVFSGAQDATVTIDLMSQTLDMYLFVTRAEDLEDMFLGRDVAWSMEDDDGGVGTNSRVSVDVTP